MMKMMQSKDKPWSMFTARFSVKILLNTVVLQEYRYILVLYPCKYKYTQSDQFIRCKKYNLAQVLQ